MNVSNKLPSFLVGHMTATHRQNNDETVYRIDTHRRARMWGTVAGILIILTACVGCLFLYSI